LWVAAHAALVPLVVHGVRGAEAAAVRRDGGARADHGTGVLAGGDIGSWAKGGVLTAGTRVAHAVNVTRLVGAIASLSRTDTAGVHLRVGMRRVAGEVAHSTVIQEGATGAGGEAVFSRTVGSAVSGRVVANRIGAHRAVVLVAIGISAISYTNTTVVKKGSGGGGGLPCAGAVLNTVRRACGVDNALAAVIYRVISGPNSIAVLDT